MSWWQRLPGVGRALAASHAAALAYQLVDQRLDDAEAVTRLRATSDGQRALLEAAQLSADIVFHGYPDSRIYRLLRAAAGQPVAALTEAEVAVEARQRQLWEQPVDVSFRELAEQVPELRELERRIRDDPGSFGHGLTFRDTGRIGGPPPPVDTQDGQVTILVELQKAIRRMVGPRSGLTDPVLASGAAERAVQLHLQDATGIDPRSWRTH